MEKLEESGMIRCTEKNHLVADHSANPNNNMLCLFSALNSNAHLKQRFQQL